MPRHNLTRKTISSAHTIYHTGVMVTKENRVSHA